MLTEKPKDIKQSTAYFVNNIISICNMDAWIDWDCIISKKVKTVLNFAMVSSLELIRIEIERAN